MFYLRKKGVLSHMIFAIRSAQKRGVRGRESGDLRRVSPRTNQSQPLFYSRQALTSSLTLCARQVGAKTRSCLSAEKREDNSTFLRIFFLRRATAALPCRPPRTRHRHLAGRRGCGGRRTRPPAFSPPQAGGVRRGGWRRRGGRLRRDRSCRERRKDSWRWRRRARCGTLQRDRFPTGFRSSRPRWRCRRSRSD